MISMKITKMIRKIFLFFCIIELNLVHLECKINETELLRGL